MRIKANQKNNRDQKDYEIIVDYKINTNSWSNKPNFSNIKNNETKVMPVKEIKSQIHDNNRLLSTLKQRKIKNENLRQEVKSKNLLTLKKWIFTFETIQITSFIKNQRE